MFNRKEVQTRVDHKDVPTSKIEEDRVPKNIHFFNPRHTDLG
jgi:hypothetical protein